MFAHCGGWGRSGACAGFLVRRIAACPLVAGAGSCPSGGRGHVKGCAYGWLWAQCGLRHPVCWWVGLCSCPAGCLARDTNLSRARSRCQNGDRQESSRLSVFSGASATGASLPAPPWVTVGLQLLWSSCFVLGPSVQETLYASCKSEVCFLQPCGPALKPHWTSKANASGIPPPDARCGRTSMIQFFFFF